MISNINDIIARASRLKICVIGDLVLDRYVNGDVERISPEAPVPILKAKSFHANPGGAGNVVENLRGLGIETSFFHQPDVPVKTRVMSGSHHLLRMDEENEPRWMRWEDIPGELGQSIIEKKYDCVIISDYGKGMVPEEVAWEIIGRCFNHSVPVVVDSKGSFHNFAEATVVKCNESEWERYYETTGNSRGELFYKFSVENIVMTLGKDGIAYWTSQGKCDTLPGIPVVTSDPCGAGDTVTAILGMMVALGYGIPEACELANAAAAEVCRHPGVYPIRKEDLLNMKL